MQEHSAANRYPLPNYPGHTSNNVILLFQPSIELETILLPIAVDGYANNQVNI